MDSFRTLKTKFLLMGLHYQKSDRGIVVDACTETISNVTYSAARLQISQLDILMRKASMVCSLTNAVAYKDIANRFELTKLAIIRMEQLMKKRLARETIIAIPGTGKDYDVFSDWCQTYIDQLYSLKLVLLEILNMGVTELRTTCVFFWEIVPVKKEEESCASKNVLGLFDLFC